MDSKGEVSREAEEYGNERLPPAGGSARLFTAQQDTAIVNMVLENNAITLKQIQRKVIEDQVVFQTINSVSLSTLDRVLRHNAVRMKQVYRVPFERNSARVKELRHDYVQVSPISSTDTLLHL
ncbi:hypothetical protein ABVT39_013502 [Epinephelus coioides]